MRRMAIASCLVALCAASSLDHPLQREARKLGQQAKVAQTPCSQYTDTQKAKCSYGKTMREMMSGTLMACAMNMSSSPGCLDKAEDIMCMNIVSSQCLPEPTNVQCSADDVGGFVEMMAKPCDKLSDANAKSACTARMMNEISDECFSCMAVNSQREERNEAQFNCWGSFAANASNPHTGEAAPANQKCLSWETTAEIMKGFTCADEKACKEYKAYIHSPIYHTYCMGCLLSVMMGPKDAKGEPTGSMMDCMRIMYGEERPCKDNQLDAARDWGLCMDAASDMKDSCESAIKDTEPDREAKEGQCGQEEKARQAVCEQNFVSPPLLGPGWTPYTGADKVTAGCSACFTMSKGKAEMCALPDQRCSAADVGAVQAGYDCAAGSAECREEAAKRLSGACRMCQMEKKEELEKTCTEPKVKDKDGEEEADYFKCIPKGQLCDLDMGTDGKVVYKPTSKAPTPAPPPPTPAPPTPAPTAWRDYRKRQAKLKLAKRVNDGTTIGMFCAGQKDVAGYKYPHRCSELAKELANKLLRALKMGLGARACKSVEVTHLCNLPDNSWMETWYEDGKLTGGMRPVGEVSNQLLATRGYCREVNELSDAGRVARLLQVDGYFGGEGTLTAVYEMDADAVLPGLMLTSVVDQAQSNGNLAVADPLGTGEDLVTGGGGTTGSINDIGGLILCGSQPCSPATDGDGSDIGMILGIVFGLLAALGLVAVAAVVVSRRKALQFQGTPSQDSATEPMYQQVTNPEQEQI